MGLRRHRRLKRWIFWTGLVALLLVVLQITALAFPSPWFGHRVRYDNLSFHADLAIAGELDRALRAAADRLRSAPLYDSTEQFDVFVISDPSTYAAFARLALVAPVVPGFNLSLLDESFVSLTGTEARRMRSAGALPYSSIEGDLAQCIAHEVMHDYMVEDIGFWRTRRLPAWKKEGYAEYGACLTLTRSDSTVPLRDRIRLMQNELLDARAREYYAWGLVVEFLCEQRGYSHADVMADSTSWETAYDQMLAWYRSP